MTTHTIQILRTTHIQGPGIWTYRPVLEALVDIGELEDRPSNTLPGFNQRLSDMLPGLIEHRCSVGERGGFLQRLENGTWAAHILEHVALELQTLAGLKTGFGKARETAIRGQYKVVIRARHPDIATSALHHARDVLESAISGLPCDLAGMVKSLSDQVDRLCLGPSTASIVDAATDRGIPHIRLNEGNLVQLGYGAAQARIWTAETDRTSAIGESISQDKDLSKRLMASCGVPVPEGVVVASPQEAWEAAQDIGLPVCIKPTDGNHARGVSLDLRSEADIVAAYHLADQEGTEVLVEKHIQGTEHRLLVVGQAVVAANRGEIASIVGDGVHTVQELVELQINSDPRRGEAEDFPLDTIRLDEHTTAVLELQRQGLSRDSVVAAGREVTIMRTSNMSTDVTDLVHPEVAAMAVLAAKVVGLDIAGVDLVAQDISKPLHVQGGAIVEINAGPGLLMHLKPAIGTPRPVGQAIVNHLIPDEQSGRIPVVGLLGKGDTAQAARLCAWLLQLSGRYTGLSSSEGLFLNNRQLQSDNAQSFALAQRLLINRNVQAAVFETSARHILTQGLPYDRCAVGIVTAIPSDEGLQDLQLHTEASMAVVARTQVDVVLSSGLAILNADDPAVADLARHCDGSVMFYAHDAKALQAHIAAGHRVAYWRGTELVFQTEQAARTVLNLNSPGMKTLLQQTPLTTQDLLIAASAAWALGIGDELIGAGIQGFGQPRQAAHPEPKLRLPAASALLH
jgi:cyanophycin synthetase